MLQLADTSTETGRVFWPDELGFPAKEFLNHIRFFQSDLHLVRSFNGAASWFQL